MEHLPSDAVDAAPQPDRTQRIGPAGPGEPRPLPPAAYGPGGRDPWGPPSPAPGSGSGSGSGGRPGKAPRGRGRLLVAVAIVVVALLIGGGVVAASYFLAGGEREGSTAAPATPEVVEPTEAPAPTGPPPVPTRQAGPPTGPPTAPPPPGPGPAGGPGLPPAAPGGPGPLDGVYFSVARQSGADLSDDRLRELGPRICAARDEGADFGALQERLRVEEPSLSSVQTGTIVAAATGRYCT